MLSTLCFGALAMVWRPGFFNFNLLHFSFGAFSTCVFIFLFVDFFIVAALTEILFLTFASDFDELAAFELLQINRLEFSRLLPVQGGLNW